MSEINVILITSVKMPWIQLNGEFSNIKISCCFPIFSNYLVILLITKKKNGKLTPASATQMTLKRGVHIKTNY